MNGIILKEKLQLIDIQLVDLAKKLGITPQSLNSRLKTKDITLSFLIDICKIVNKSPYYFIKGTEYEKSFNFEENSYKPDILGEPEEKYTHVINKLEFENAALRKENAALQKDKEFLQSLLQRDNDDKSQTA